MLKTYLAVLVCSFGTCLGALVLSVGVHDVVVAAGSERWPTVTGEIIASDIERGTGRQYRTYYPRVAYRYRVGERVYVGDRIDPGAARHGAPLSEASAIVGRYPVGQAVVVHIDPEDPAISTLLTGAGTKQWFMVGIGAVFTALGLVMAWLALRPRPVWPKAPKRPDPRDLPDPPPRPA